jgi:predicted aspartyl protease
MLGRLARTTAACVAAMAMGLAGGAQAQVVIPLLILKAKQGGRIALAPVEIHGHRYLFVLDTGAEYTVINTRVARALHLRAFGKPVRSQGVGTAVGRLVRVGNWALGPQPLPGSIAVRENLQLPRRVAGLLGSDVLSRFGAVLINYANGTLILP